MTSKKAMPAGRTPAAQKIAPATPEMIEAVFAVLHLQGWRPRHSSPWTVLPKPVLRGKVKPPTRAQVAAAWELASQLGWTPLNEQEKRMIVTLRRATYRGRNIAADLVSTIARTYPWIDGDMTHNTEE